MRTLEDYWKDFENFGFIKHSKIGRTDFILSSEKGEGAVFVRLFYKQSFFNI